jgi:hypothetical protein
LPRGAALACVLFAAWPAAHGQRLTLTLDDVAGNGFSARGIRVEVAARVSGKSAAVVEIGALQVGGEAWKNLKLACPALTLGARIACEDGVLTAGVKVPVRFQYTPRTRELDATLAPAPRERYRIQLQPGTKGADVRVTIEDGDLKRLAPWIPKEQPRLTGGTVSGNILYAGDGAIALNLAAGDVAFSDSAGLHAGEKIGVNLSASARPSAGGLAWQAALTWQAGEMFWQPLYLKAQGQQLVVTGEAGAKHIAVEHAVLRYPGMGEVEFSARYDTAAKTFTAGRATARALDAGALYETVLKPLLDGTSFSDLRVEGAMSADLRLGAGGLQGMDVNLSRLSFEDRAQRRFALFDVNGLVPWRAREATRATFSARGGEILKMPVGAFSATVDMNGLYFAMKALRVPLLDGRLEVNDFIAQASPDGWFWQFTGGAEGISMDRLTAALGAPVMHGELSLRLPMVRNVNAQLRVDGALSMKAFDGEIRAENLTLLDLFGKAPRVHADITMKHLDLGLVTRTYAFGNITGRIDGQVRGLELANWRPVKFDVKVASSHGAYPRKISQAAVQNISALGGAGAAAAIQRSFLRFFEQFGYERIGWGCKLAHGTCEMSGVEDKPQGYVIVKGGGIPAITVMGYNRQVSWDELLSRLQRVTQGNAKPVIQ